MTRSAQYEIAVAAPYRLDLTVSALRRLSTNVVDVLTPEAEYLRTLEGFRKPVLARVAQTRRVILALGSPVKCGDITLHAFPSATSLCAAGDHILLAAGVSANKLATLRRLADALLSGSLDEAMLDERPSPDAAAILCRIKGIGPWTATVILLRGLGRLDVFPMNDSSVARNLALVGEAPPHDIGRVLTELGPQRGMLYYHLLLARLGARNEIGRASFT